MSALARRLAFGAVVMVLAVTCSDIVRVQLDTQPRILSTIPANGATGIDLAAPVVVYFSEPVDPATVTTESLAVESGGVRVNGTATVTATAATLTFDSPLAYLTTYTAVATTAILDLTGATLNSAQTWTFTTRDLAWTPATIISPAGVDAYKSPAVFDPQGDAWVAITQGIGTFDLFVRRFSFADGWLPAQSIENRSETALESRLAIDGSGNVLAVWIQSDGAQESLWSNRWQPSAGWSGPQLVEFAASPVFSPSLVVDSTGNALVIWVQDDATGPRDLWTNRYQPGIGWGTPALLETSEAGHVNVSTLAGDPSGRAIAVWTQSDGSVLNAFASRYVPGSGWTAATPIDTSSSDVPYAELVMDRQGRALACLSEAAGTLLCNRFDGMAWSGPVQVASGANVLGMGPNGEAAVLYFELGAVDLVRVRIFDPDSGWSAPETIDSSDSSPYDPSVAIDARGTVVATYSLFGSTYYDAWVTRRPAGGSVWSEPAQIESAAEPVFRVPVTLRDDGAGLAVWNQSDGVRNRFWTSVLR